MPRDPNPSLCSPFDLHRAMGFCDSARVCTIALLLGASIGLSGCRETYTAGVSTEQKISDKDGNFSGDLDDYDRFGRGITRIGDLESDGVVDLAVGAPGDDDGGIDRGAVWILFLDSDGEVDVQQKISADQGGFEGDLDDGDAFGLSAANLDDLNGDGFLDLAVGAPGDDDGGANHGALWLLFLRDDGRVRLYQKISEETGGFDGNLDASDGFGTAIANLGDLDRDGIDDLAVGAPGDDDGGGDRGAVWILFLNQDGTVKASQKISSSEGDLAQDPENGDRFGTSVTAIGDLNGDGHTDLAVGAPGDDDGGPDRGAVWILLLNSDGTVDGVERISQTRGEFDGDLSDYSGFGSALANLGDLNDDGIDELAVGAEAADDGGTDRGAVWILFLDDSAEVISTSRLSDTRGSFDGGLDDGDAFGCNLASIGDLDGDNLDDLAVSACGDDDGGVDKGAVWILFLADIDIHIDTSGGVIFGQF
ncbi:MAG: integrin alpha [Candidatus Thiodiazotropha sp.]